MATKNSNYITLMDILSTAGTSPKHLVDLTSRMNPMLTDAPAFECNMGTYHRVPIKKGLAKFVWGKSYQGVPVSKGRQEAIDFTTGYVESELEVARKDIDNIENYVRFAALKGKARKNAVGMEQTRVINREQETHNETLSQGVADALWYESETKNPNRITGFTPYFDSLSGETASQIINAGGTGTENCSAWMITWHETTNHLIYPMGERSRGGLKTGPLEKSFNIDMDEKSEGYKGKYNTYRKTFEWHTGLSKNDYRYVARVGGIDVATLSKGKNVSPTVLISGADLIDLFTDAHYQHRGRRLMKGKTCWYMNTTLVKFLDYQARNTPKNLYLYLKQTGTNAKEVLTFRDVPIKESDALHNNESPVGA